MRPGRRPAPGAARRGQADALPRVRQDRVRISVTCLNVPRPGVVRGQGIPHVPVELAQQRMHEPAVGPERISGIEWRTGAPARPGGRLKLGDAFRSGRRYSLRVEPGFEVDLRGDNRDRQPGCLRRRPDVGGELLRNVGGHAAFAFALPILTSSDRYPRKSGNVLMPGGRLWNATNSSTPPSPTNSTPSGRLAACGTPTLVETP